MTEGDAMLEYRSNPSNQSQCLVCVLDYVPWERWLGPSRLDQPRGTRRVRAKKKGERTELFIESNDTNTKKVLNNTNSSEYVCIPLPTG